MAFSRTQTHTHTHSEINSFYGVYSIVLFSVIHTHASAPTLRQRSQFKRIKSTADYVCRYYPKNQRCAFSKETQTITDLITPELYRSCCSVFTLSDMAETTAQIRTEWRFSSQLSWLASYHKPQKSQCQTELGTGPTCQRTPVQKQTNIMKAEFLYLLAAAGSVL